MQTRWFLHRHEAHPKLIRLVVEELGAQQRGCTIAVTSRREAHEMLPVLRKELEQRILQADTTPSATYSPCDSE